MNRTAILLLLAALAGFSAPVPVIFDTDMGNDIDDALALAMLHSLESRGECRLIGVTLTNPAPTAAPFTQLVNRFYGRAGIPVGRSAAQRKEGASRKFLDATLEGAPANLRPAGGTTYEPAVPLLRRLLAASTGKVVLVQVGFSENLAELLDSKADSASPLDGAALVRQKVALVSAMAGDFTTDKPEFNVRINVPAARHVLQDWPTPVIVSGFEIGKVLLFPAASIEHDFAYAPWHPVAAAYRAYMKMPYDRPTWDLTAVLAAVRPQAGYFELSPPGNIAVDEQGRTAFRADAAGTRRYLVLAEAARARVLEALILLSSEPPGIKN